MALLHRREVDGQLSRGVALHCWRTQGVGALLRRLQRLADAPRHSVSDADRSRQADGISRVSARVDSQSDGQQPVRRIDSYAESRIECMGYGFTLRVSRVQ